MSEHLPSSWVWAKIGEVFAVNPPNVGDMDDASLVSFVPMPAVKAMTGRVSTGEAKRFADVKKGFTPFSEGDVLFAKITPSMENGKVAVARDLIGGRGFGSTEFHVARPLADMPPAYAMFFMLQQTIRSEAKFNMTGTAGQRRVPTDYFSSISFPLPPVAEQQRIVEEIEKQFTRLDAAVAALRAAQARLKRYRASVLNAAVTGRLVPTEAALARTEGRDYEPASVLLERIQCERQAVQECTKPRRRRVEPTPRDTSNLPGLPEGWAWAVLDQISDIQGGVTKGKRRAADVLVREVPYLRVANVQRGILNLSTMKLIRASEKEIATLRLLPGDILFTEGGDRDKLGRGWIWQGEIDECIHQNHVFRSRLISLSILPEFVSYWSNSLGQRYFLNAGKQTTNLASINLSVLRRLPIAIPPCDEQHRIITEVARLSSCLNAAEVAVEANLKRAERLRQAILKRAFEGRLVLQDPDDEPAAVLLERVKTEKAAAAQAPRRGRRAAKGRHP